MSKKLSYVSVALFILAVGTIFYLINLYTPLISDDYLYSYYLTPTSAKSFAEGTFIGFNQKISSLTDIFHSQYNHYFYVNGRTIPHIVEQFFAGILGKEWFNYFNVCFFVAFVALIIWGTGYRNLSRFPYWATGFLLFWFLLPYPGDVILPMVCAINYLWSAVLCLSFLLVYFRMQQVNKVHWWVIVAAFLLGVIAGWTHEALVVGISGALFIETCINYKRGLKVSVILMTVGFWFGSLLVCLSPAAHGRAFLEHPSIWQTLLMMASEFRAFYLLLFLLFCLFLRAKMFNKQPDWGRFICDNRFYFYIILIDFSFSLFIGYRNVRQLFGIEVFSIALIMKLLCFFVQSKRSWFTLFSYIVAGGLLLHMALVVPYAKKSFNQSQEIVSAYVQSEDGIVCFEKMSFPYLLDRYVWRFGDYLDWECSCLSIYYSEKHKPMKVQSLNSTLFPED